jgi:tetratricopeptide (TPR) repeat protein
MKRIIFTVVTAVFLISALAQTALAADTLQEAYLKATAAANSGDKTAMSIMRTAVEAVKEEPLSGEDLFYAGSMATRARRYDFAIQCLERYLKTDGKNAPVAAANLIESYTWKNRLDSAIALFGRFTTEYANADQVDPLNRKIPCRIEADLAYYLALVRAGKSAEAIVPLKRALEAIGDNADGVLDDMTFLNYHSYLATLTQEYDGWEAAVDYLQTKVQPLFADKPAFDAKVRDRILFIKLDHYIGTEQYAVGLAELQQTLDSFKVDDVSYRRVSKALKRFSLFDQPAPELVGHAWIGGPPTSLAKLKGKVVFLYFFWSG